MARAAAGPVVGTRTAAQRGEGAAEAEAERWQIRRSLPGLHEGAPSLLAPPPASAALGQLPASETKAPRRVVRLYRLTPRPAAPGIFC